MNEPQATQGAEPQRLIGVKAAGATLGRESPLGTSPFVCTTCETTFLPGHRWGYAAAFGLAAVGLVLYGFMAFSEAESARRTRLDNMVSEAVRRAAGAGNESEPQTAIEAKLDGIQSELRRIRTDPEEPVAWPFVVAAACTLGGLTLARRRSPCPRCGSSLSVPATTPRGARLLGRP